MSNEFNVDNYALIRYPFMIGYNQMFTEIEDKKERIILKKQ